MKWFLFFTFILSLRLSAFEIKKRDDKIILQASTCSQVKEITESLIKWTENAQEKNICPPFSQVHEIKNGNCEFDITKCIPSQVAKYQGVTPKFHGPNCWNSALVASGILPFLRQTTEEEFVYYMNSPLCKKLKNGEQKRPGDIGAIRGLYDGEKHEMHGFIYISEKIAYSKNSGLSWDSYALQPLENVYERYPIAENEQCRQNEFELSSECMSGVLFFRCISMSEYLQKNEDIPNEIIKAVKDVNNFEECLQARMINGNNLSETVIRNVADSFSLLAKYLKDRVSHDRSAVMQSLEENFILGSLKLGLDSIGQQLVRSEGLDDKYDHII